MIESSADPENLVPQEQGETIPQGDSVDYGVEPVRIICQNCQADVITGTFLKTGKYAILLGMAIFFTGVGALGLFLIPCFKAKFKDTVHECPNCGYKVGRHKHC